MNVSLPVVAEGAKPSSKPKTKLVRRTDRDHSQIVRRGFQLAFLLLNVWIGVVFYFWVRQFESGGTPTTLQRPAGVEGWLPIAGLMNLKYFAWSGHIPQLHPAGMFLLITFLVISVCFRKAFCGWLCPVGTISEYLWRIGRKLWGRNFRPPSWLDIGLRGLKYLLLGFFVWAVASMTVDQIASFMSSPYGIIADVKMLNFFRHIGETGAIVLGVLAAASLFIQNFWCRYLCPYGAMLGIVALLSPMHIRRSSESCIDCAKCAKACPASLPVDKLRVVRSVECTGCLECLAACPSKDTLNLALPSVPGRGGGPMRVPMWVVAAGIAAMFFGIIGFAKVSGHWDSRIPREMYEQLVPFADMASHPMPGE